MTTTYKHILSITVPTLFVLFFTTAAILIYELDIIPKIKYNNSFAHTKCNIIDNYIETSNDCSNKYTRNKHCQTEYNGFIYVKYNVTSSIRIIEHFANIIVYSNFDDRKKLVNALAKSYHPTKNIDCWYDENRPTSVIIYLQSTVLDYVWFWSMIFGIVISIIIILISAIKWWKNYKIKNNTNYATLQHNDI